MKDLIIVESPHKTIAISEFLGKDNYIVSASKGHVRDLKIAGSEGLGVNIDDTKNPYEFSPVYEISSTKAKTVKELKALVKNAKHVYLATDPDREGEAIAWHLKEVLELKEGEYDRVTFNEITKNVVLEGMKNPRSIDMDLVHSQETRRILDRIIGFKLSAISKKYVSGGIAAGRVQSVALKLICDREEEIRNFVHENFYTITSIFPKFEADLKKYKGEKYEEIPTEEEADKVISSLAPKYLITNIEKKEKDKASLAPFKTSTLQQTAINQLSGFNSKKTMTVAQHLYEGKKIGAGTVGLITYMRTDSERMSPEFINETFEYIEKNYGKDYVGFVKKQKKDENMQDAHECIRVTSIYRTPESIEKYLDKDEFKLYSLIYARSLAALMAPRKYLATDVTLMNNDYEFHATGNVTTFDGYSKIYSTYEKVEDTVIPELEVNTEIGADEVKKEEHEKKGPARYTEASLVKELESKGIGRPSTYATIIDRNFQHKYIDKDKKNLFPTELGEQENKFLQENFNNFINETYTKEMEDKLDDISEKKEEGNAVLTDAYQKIAGDIDETKKTAVKLVVKVGRECPECGGDLVERNGKFGKFIACSNYPTCKYTEHVEQPKPETDGEVENTEPKEEPIPTGEKCPECGGDLVERKGRYGKFVACSNFPTCKYIKKEEKEVVEVCKCPNCKTGMIVERVSHKFGKTNTFYGCNNYPKCRTTFSKKPTGEKCPECGEMLVEGTHKIECSNKMCEFEKEK